MKIQIIDGKDKTLLGYVNKLFVFKSLLMMPGNNSTQQLKKGRTSLMDDPLAENADCKSTNSKH